MKTNYFTLKDINDQARGFADKLPESSKTHKPNFKPHESALLILDMQSYFLDSASHAFIPSAVAIVPGIKKLAREYYANNLPVLFTQHINTPEDAGAMSRWWRDLITIENPLSAIIRDFDFSNRYVIRKSQYDAFYQTNLEDILKSKGVSQIVVSGVMTHLCCETTARAAFVRGFDVFFLIDGTATYNEDHHLATLLNLSHGLAAPVLTYEIMVAVNQFSKDELL